MSDKKQEIMRTIATAIMAAVKITADTLCDENDGITNTLELQLGLALGVTNEDSELFRDPLIAEYKRLKGCNKCTTPAKS